ncbi:Hypothetical protein EIN_136690, partial [Entamoeba invadens IP1]
MFYAKPFISILVLILFVVYGQISDVCQCTPNGNDETNGFFQTNGISCAQTEFLVFCFNKDFTFSSGSKFYEIITQSSLTFNTSGSLYTTSTRFLSLESNVINFRLLFHSEYLFQLKQKS